MDTARVVQYFLIVSAYTGALYDDTDGLDMIGTVLPIGNGNILEAGYSRFGSSPII